MKQILVISGKGGTGKTVITASFANLAERAVMADCDVDAADLHLLLAPETRERYEFRSGKTAVINRSKCTRCGTCVVKCRFDAVSEDDFTVDPVACEGCGVCFHVCPAGAVAMKENLSGEWFVSDTKRGPFVHAKLGVAEENSGKLVTLVRQKAKEIAEAEGLDTVIIDGSPGIGCPVIASISGVDAAVIVTEPTISGLHDMTRVMELSEHFGVTPHVVVNKYDLNANISDEIENFCKTRNKSFAGRVSFDPEITAALIKGRSIIEHSDGGASPEIRKVWEYIRKKAGIK